MANVIKFGYGLKSLSELTTEDSKAIVDMYNSIKNDVKYEIMKIDTISYAESYYCDTENRYQNKS